MVEFGMTLTWENRRTQEKPLSYCYFLIKNPTLTRLESNPGLRGDRLEIMSLLPDT
jgi:hypothetical protein